MADFQLEAVAREIARHQMTRHSTTDDPSGYRVWVSCRCRWVSDDVDDPNVPHVEAVKAEHVAEAVLSMLAAPPDLPSQEDVAKALFMHRYRDQDVPVKWHALPESHRVAYLAQADAVLGVLRGEARG